MANVVLVGTLDTKGAEYGFVRERLRAAGLDTVVIDCGVLGPPQIAPDIARDEVARAAGADAGTLAAAGDRGVAVQAMARGAEAILRRLHGEGRLDGAMALGGGGGTSIAARAFQALPLGVPKLIVSTMASGDTRPYVGESDIALFPSVVDVAGVNRISARILANAAAAMAGMVGAPPVADSGARTLVAASMFGVTTACVTEGRRLLEADGYEVLTFHMTGTGGRTLEQLVDNGLVAGVLDITTTELADELVGGVLSAGPARLARRGNPPVPRVVSVGALDMVNFGPRGTVPAKFQSRKFVIHNPSVTLMRTTREENRAAGQWIGERLNRMEGPVRFLLPEGGVSLLDRPGQPFHDPEADAALFEAIEKTVRQTSMRRVERVKGNVNDDGFVAALVTAFHSVIPPISKRA